MSPTSQPSSMERIFKIKKQIRKNIRSKVLALPREEIQRESQKIFTHFFNLPEYQKATSIGLFLSMPQGEIQTYDACCRVLHDKKRLYVPRVGLQFEQGEMDLVQVKVEGLETSEEEEKDSDMTTTSTRPPFYEHWPRNLWGIPEPPILPIPSTMDPNHDTYNNHHHHDKMAQKGDLDILIVPGCAFDQYGGRIGQGKGYYDRFIHRMMMTTTTYSSELDHNYDNHTPSHGIQSTLPLLVGVALEPSFISDNDDGRGGGMDMILNNNEMETIDSKIPMLEHDIYMNIIITPTKVLRL